MGLNFICERIFQYKDQRLCIKCLLVYVLTSQTARESFPPLSQTSSLASVILQTATKHHSIFPAKDRQ